MQREVNNEGNSTKSNLPQPLLSKEGSEKEREKNRMKEKGDSWLRQLRNLFFTGLLVVVPTGATIFIIFKLFNLSDAYIRNALQTPFNEFCQYVFKTNQKTEIPPYGIGLIVTILAILSAGILARNLVGRKILAGLENLMLRVPLVNKIYLAIKQISEALLHRNKTLFREVILVEYPRIGIYSLGFVTNDAPKLFDRLEGDSVCVFVSTTPNPTSGVLIIVPRRDVIPLNISVEDGMKMVISGGVVIPEILSRPSAAIKDEMEHGTAGEIEQRKEEAASEENRTDEHQADKEQQPVE